ncbi:hypothetical protein FKM82_007627 [Ascaphus truei]
MSRFHLYKSCCTDLKIAQQIIRRNGALSFHHVSDMWRGRSTSSGIKNKRTFLQSLRMCVTSVLGQHSQHCYK